MSLTDRQAFEAVFANLTAGGIAHHFGLRGSTGVREDNLNAYKRTAKAAGTTRWVGTHVGSDDCGGGRWGRDGRLYYRNRFGEDIAEDEVFWSFPMEYPEVAEYLVYAFREQGIKVDWTGNVADCVVVTLADA